MSNVAPISSLVRPRAFAPRDGGPQLLDDIIAQIADELSTGLIWLIGHHGSGKSTAIRYLSEVFAADARLAFFDEPSIEEVREAREDRLVVAAALSPAGVGGIVLRLSPWGADDLIEYLHAAGHADCNSILSRILSAGPATWQPEVAQVVLQRFATDPFLADQNAAITAEVRAHLTKPPHVTAVAQYCLAALSNNNADLLASMKVLKKIRCPQPLVKLLRHTCVQIPLASDRLAETIAKRTSLQNLSKVLPRQLIKETATRCQRNELAVKSLRHLMTGRRSAACHAMAASILRYADPTWRPTARIWFSYNFTHAYLDGVDWPDISLANSNLHEADLTNANLQSADLSDVNATSAVFVGANLQSATLTRIRASRANFERANLAAASLPRAELAHASLIRANLTEASLVSADLASTDLTEANFTRADLCGAKLSGAQFEDINFTQAKLDSARLAHADLRTATLDGASFDAADLAHAQLEDIVVRDAAWRRARLDYAHFTGSRMPNADLREASLAFAHLADIEWPGANLSHANLRGASFHMGSSRSGLVGSPIACEGSKTGFYTDDREEMYFKRPEEIRKANLRDADLRGANIANVDFYLVDLRGATLDPAQRIQAEQTGAILADWEVP